MGDSAIEGAAAALSSLVQAALRVADD